MSSVLENSLVLPFLEVNSINRWKGILTLKCTTVRRPLACSQCASKCEAIYDQRLVRLRDEKIRNFHVKIEVWKKRYFCKVCKKPRTEPIDGVLPGRRTTQRLQRWVKRLCKSYSNLEAVCHEARVSRDFVYRAFYEQLDLELRKRKAPWPKAIGIDEHSFKRRKHYGGTEFACLLVNHIRKKPIELVEGKTGAALDSQLAHIPGRENVQWVTLDLCDTFKSWCRRTFPQAQMVADPFHVLRLLTPEINRTRKEITGDRRTLKIRRTILKNRNNLAYEEKLELDRFLSFHPRLEELYYWKEKLYRLYRTRGYDRAKEALYFMLDEMASSQSPAILRLRKTLQKWAKEILAHFLCGLTNARVEGFNNVAKTIKKQAYGFRSFKNYRLRVLNARI